MARSGRSRLRARRGVAMHVGLVPWVEAPLPFLPRVQLQVAENSPFVSCARQAVTGQCGQVTAHSKPRENRSSLLGSIH